MQALVIKQADGLWTAETSSGVRWAAASLPSLLAKMLPSGTQVEAVGGCAGALVGLFQTIPDIGSGQIGSGVAGA